MINKFLLAYRVSQVVDVGFFCCVETTEYTESVKQSATVTYTKIKYRKSRNCRCTGIIRDCPE